MRRAFNVISHATIAAALLASAPLTAATLCNLGPTACSGAPPTFGCQRGCAASIAVLHAFTDPCGSGGAFNLIGTQYENTCQSGTGGCTVDLPPLRFWEYGATAPAGYNTANSGCQDPVANQWLVNASLDFAIPVANGYWDMFQANWNGNGIDGCIGSGRTVAEISFPDAANEGMASHRSYYLVAAVPQTPVGYDFDTITGGTSTVPAGCTAATVPAQLVPPPTIVNRTAPCTGSPTATSGTDNAVDGANYGDIDLNLSDPQWFTEAGRNAAPPLIAGYQVVYATGAEPTSSNSSTGPWQPVHSTTNPTMAKGVVPVPVTNPVRVTVPKGGGGNFWFAVRVVYHDGSINPTTEFDPASANAGPRVYSHVSSHCGPVTFGTGPVIAVEFADVKAERTASGVNIRWTTIREDDTIGFQVIRSTDAAGTESVVEAAPWVSAMGASSYVAQDVASPRVNETYYYYVQEYTSSGLGDRSEVVKVDALADLPGTSTGSRGRSRGVRR